MFQLILEWISLIVPVLLNVAFFTLMERKILGLSQSRKGPNKVGFTGILQPFADALKLFFKELVFPSVLTNKMIFLTSPLLALSLSLVMWSILPTQFLPSTEHSFLLFLTIMSLSLYPLLLAGWSSMSNYATIGALRGVAQTISYEISMALILLTMIIATNTLSWFKLSEMTSTFSLFWALSPIILMWLICCVAETNRTPFDFAEGESELVSGFNVEYSGGMFAVIFMAEYSSILVLSAFTSILILAKPFSVIPVTLTIILAYFWVWLRTTLPRYRYDKLMGLAWKSILPLSLSYLMFFT